MYRSNLISTSRFRAVSAALGTALALALGFLALAPTASAQTGASPVGTWQTIDDHTGQPKALVQISESGGELSGKVVKGLGPNDRPDRRCTACTDERKDQLMLGMKIIDGMKHVGSGWEGGHILDPENGSIYKCKMQLADDGNHLVVRGYIGISLLGRSQTWIRQP